MTPKSPATCYEWNMARPKKSPGQLDRPWKASFILPVCPEVKAGGGYCNTELQSIEFVRSPALSNAAHIAAFLHAIFPNLNWINVGDGTGVGMSWQPVQDIVGVLRGAPEWQR